MTRFWICLGFWICQRSESTGVLNIPGLWICHGSEYASGSGYVRILEMPQFYIPHSYTGFWICLNNFWICLNVPKSVWIVFVLHLLIVIPYLKEPQMVFLKSKKNRFFYSSWKYFIFCFVFTRFQICRYLWGLRGVMNLDMTNQWYTQQIFPWCFFNDLFIYFVVVVFPLFGASKGLIRDSQRL